MGPDRWCGRVSDDAMRRRAGGRRRYNAVRQFRALSRRGQVAEVVGLVGMRRGYQSEIARLLNVSRAIICKDVAALCRNLRARRAPPRAPPFEDWLREQLKRGRAGPPG